MSRTSFVICRISPTAPAGCAYFTGAIQIRTAEDGAAEVVIGHALAPDDVLSITDEWAAEKVAFWLNAIGGEEEPGAGLWKHLPYIIRAGRAA